MTGRLIGWSAGVALLLQALVALAAEVSVRDVPTRPGVVQRVLLIKPEQPVASVVLFAGGNGLVQIGQDASLGRGGNFLVRSRARFAREGFLVAVVDAPSDRIDGPALDYFRQTAEHASDVAHVIAHLREETKRPVWLIGTSRGTTSVANAVIRLREQTPDGIVLTASMVGPDRERLPSMAIESIRVPALVVHHENDECRYCLLRDVPALMAGLKGAAKSELITFKGGGPVKGDPCQAFHYHGFIGIEDEVVKRIADWIKSQLSGRV
ncbi:MAG TPA: alpha/beta hydrolase [Burkholderiales bacterium]|nr:alpha/beta hydrolase [Burkholderiales bacterium]